MKFHSIKEYFYKLTTIGFILLLVPLVVFISLYYYLITHRPVFVGKQSEIILLSIAVGISLVALTIVHWLFRERLKRLRNQLELARKMDGFFSISVLRMGVYCGCELVAGIGFYLTASSLFTGLFILIVIAGVFQWPAPSTFCRMMALRGAERDMIINNRDLYQKRKRT